MAIKSPGRGPEELSEGLALRANIRYLTAYLADAGHPGRKASSNRTVIAAVAALPPFAILYSILSSLYSSFRRGGLYTAVVGLPSSGSTLPPARVENGSLVAR